MKRSQSSSGLQTPFKDRKTARPDSVAQLVDSRLATNVVYIAANHDRSKCIQGVRNAIEAGATIINISFEMTSADNIRQHILIELGTAIDDAEWLSSVGQPAYSCRKVGSVMSLYKNDVSNVVFETLDPEKGLPAILLTFSVPGGRICTITTSFPPLPKRTRARLLELYTNAASSTKADTILIGGTFADAILFIENQVTQLDLAFEIYTNADLGLLANCCHGFSTQCVALDTEQPFSFMAIVERTNNLSEQSNPITNRVDVNDSAAQPVPHLAVTLRPRTPLYDNLIADLEPAANQHPQGHAFIDYISKSCFFGNLLMKNRFGETLEKPMPLAVKMEQLLEEALQQRRRHFFGRELASDRRTYVNTDMRIEENDMKKIYNEWRNHPEEYMQRSTLEEYNDMKRRGENQKAHRLRQSCFSAYLFHLSGCKFLLHKLIQLPLIKQNSSYSVAQPVSTVLIELINSYEDHKKTPQYAEAVQRSAKHCETQKRLSHKIWWAQYDYTQGKALAMQVKDGSLEFDSLNAKQQELVEAFETRRSAKALDRLLEQKRPPYRGAGPESSQ